MTREELHQFIIAECKRHPHAAGKAEQIAGFILSQPSLQSEAGVKGFLDGFLGMEAS